MKRTFYIYAIAVIMAILDIQCQDIQKNKYSAEVEERINQVENNLSGWVRTQYDEKVNLEEQMKLYNINGVSIAVVHDNKIEWAKGYGLADVSEQRPVTEKTLFQAASLSKSLNGVGVVKLAQDKKIDLNTDINQYLSKWKFPYDSISKNKPITIAALLSHTAGLTIHGFPGYAKGDSIPALPQILDGQKPANTGPVRSIAEPGTNVIYSGGGVTISQLIVMDVTKEPYDVYMQKNVLDPLGMKSSFFTQPPSESRSKLLATGYKADGTEVAGKYHIYPEQAAAGLWTNPVDLCKYIIETQSSWNGQSGKVLSPEFTKLRLTPVLQESALGIFVHKTDSSEYFMHSGGNEGFSCYYTGDLKGNGVVIMTNSDNGALLQEVANSVAVVYSWEGYYKPEIKNVVEVNEVILDNYIGKYDVEGTIMTIQKADKGLVLVPYGGLAWKILFTSDTEFFVKEYRGYLQFTTDDKGTVNGFIINGMPVKKVE